VKWPVWRSTAFSFIPHYITERPIFAQALSSTSLASASPSVSKVPISTQRLSRGHSATNIPFTARTRYATVFGILTFGGGFDLASAASIWSPKCLWNSRALCSGILPKQRTGDVPRLVALGIEQRAAVSTTRLFKLAIKISNAVLQLVAEIAPDEKRAAYGTVGWLVAEYCASFALAAIGCTLLRDRSTRKG